jgi:uracil phosphoribosyltransferase
MAIKVLLENGVKSDRIMFLNLICAPEGLQSLKKKYPDVQIITAAIDERLNEHRFIVPGLGDYGDRYYQTE